MKKLLPLLILVLLFASCKSKSNIVTSKEVAVEKGIYEYNKEKSIVIEKKAKKEQKEREKQKAAIAKKEKHE